VEFKLDFEEKFKSPLPFSFIIITKYFSNHFSAFRRKK